MTTLRWSLEEDLQHYRRHGITRIGLSRAKVSEFGAEQSAAFIDAHEISPTSLSWGGGFTCSNGFEYRESIDDAIDALRTAKIIGAPVLNLVTGGQGRFTPKHVRNLVVHTLRKLGDRAASMGIQLALQPMHPRYARTTSLVTTLRETIDLLDLVKHPAVGMVVDLFALGGDVEFLSLLPGAVRYCSLVTLSDASPAPRSEYDRVMLGEGSLPLIPAIQLLEQSGYRGHYEMQSLSEQTWSMNYDQLLRNTVGYFDQRCELILPPSAASIPLTLDHSEND